MHIQMCADAADSGFWIAVLKVFRSWLFISDMQGLVGELRCVNYM